MATTKKVERSASGGLIDNIKTIVYAVLIVVVLRTIVFEPFNIPSGSMIPTLQVGDYLVVSKFSYGFSHFSLPFSPAIFPGRIFGQVPDRGDVVVFKYPGDTSEDYIKRVIGLPGDHIQVRQGELYINGTEVPRTDEGRYIATDENGTRMALHRWRETLPGGVSHDILKATSEGPVNNTDEYVVPPGHIFCMGDNRDDSSDSRIPVSQGGVGYVPLENLVGHAQFIFFSAAPEDPWWAFWDWPQEIRWGRFGHPIS